MSELKRLKSRYEPWEALLIELEDVQALYALAVEENDAGLEPELLAAIEALGAEFQSLQTLILLGEETDSASAFVTIHSGAGGTESCDWTSMLYRMYGRWVESRGFRMTLLDMQEAEGGIKSVDIQIDGDFAFGLLKGEGGIHRLVRISPFDASGRRHTSFASVMVLPELDDDVEVEIQDKDIRIDTYRASGAGGQHVNKTDSAIRITHLPTGIVVQCQNERSQHRNKDMAMKMLAARLYEKEKEEQAREHENLQGDKKEIAWGSQIRSYVLQPYRLIKDHRTNHEEGNVDAVLDGRLDQFIKSYLLWQP